MPTPAPRFAVPPATQMRLRDLARMHMMFGGDLLRSQRPEEAEAYLRAALAIDPDLTTALGLLARALLDTLRADEAIHVLRVAVAREPDNLYHRGTLGSALLLAGRYAEGWPDWIATRALSPPMGEASREWTGQPLRGRTLLVVCCDGFGDAFQFSRYLPSLAANGAKIILAAPAAAIPVLRRVAGVAAIVDRLKPRPPHDLWTEDKLLPLRLGTTLANIPLACGHLNADPARQAHWAARLEQLQPRAGRMRVGLVWGGDPRNDQDAARSIPQGQAAATLAPLLALPGLAFAALQHGPRGAEAESLKQLRPDLLDLGPALADFGETAAMLANLDLLIGVETGATHLASAMAMPCWLMLSRRPDWRWLLSGERSPWYDTARLWRQPALGDWRSVVASMTTALAEMTGAG